MAGYEQIQGIGRGFFLTGCAVKSNPQAKLSDMLVYIVRGQKTLTQNLSYAKELCGTKGSDPF